MAARTCHTSRFPRLLAHILGSGSYSSQVFSNIVLLYLERAKAMVTSSPKMPF